MSAPAPVTGTAKNPTLKERADRIGALCFLRDETGTLHILTEHVEVADSENLARRWKLPQGELDKPTLRPGEDVRQLLLVNFGIAAEQTSIWEVRMDVLKDELPPSERQRKGFIGTYTTWVAVQYYGSLKDTLATARIYKWIPLANLTEECQSFRIAMVTEVSRLLDGLTTPH